MGECMDKPVGYAKRLGDGDPGLHAWQCDDEFYAIHAEVLPYFCSPLHYVDSLPGIYKLSFCEDELWFDLSVPIKDTLSKVKYLASR